MHSSFIALAAALLAPSADVAAQTPVWHADWAGVWADDIAKKSCSNDPLGSWTDQNHVICTGDEFELPMLEYPSWISCTGTINSTSIDVDCTGSNEVWQDCFAVRTITIDGSRSDDSYSIDIHDNLIYQGGGAGCSQTPPICFRWEHRADRTGPEPPECDTPAQSSSWGTVKAAYR
jgi:hypothetical protein